MANGLEESSIQWYPGFYGAAEPVYPLSILFIETKKNEKEIKK